MKKKFLSKMFILTAIFIVFLPETAFSGLSSIKNRYKNTYSTEGAARENIAWMDIERISHLEEIAAAAKDIRKKFDTVVLFGIGGSDLGARALQWALAHGSLYNSLSKRKRNGPLFFFAGDNANAIEERNLLSIIDPKRSLIIAVSKSGTTAETLGSFLPLFDKFRKALGDKRVGKHIVAITGKSDESLLRKLNDQFHFRYVLDIEDGVGGRFSVLSPVGLLPAAVQGIDIKELLRGASMARSDALSNVSNTDLASRIAKSTVRATNRGKNILAFFPFDGRLKVFSRWFRQLWSESLGKKRRGSTPLALVGSTDNHSVQQLILDGPRDKFVILVGVRYIPDDVRIAIPEGNQYKNLSYLNGVGLAELLRTMVDATEMTYRKNGIGYLRFDLPSVDAHNIGRMIMQLELATAWAGELMGIDPFNQPAVGEGKRYVKEILSNRK